MCLHGLQFFTIGLPLLLLLLHILTGCGTLASTQGSAHAWANLWMLLNLQETRIGFRLDCKSSLTAQAASQ